MIKGLLSTFESALRLQQPHRSIMFKISKQFLHPATINYRIQQQKTDSSSANPHLDKQTKLKASSKITLITPNQTMSVTSLEEAQKIAKRRDLRLLQVQELDSKTQRPIYKLATASQLISEDLEEIKPKNDNRDKSSQKKSEKTLTIGSRISDHDLSSRLKNICKWLAKQHEVRILVQGGSNEMANIEKIVKSIEQHIKEPELMGKIVQKRVKGNVVKFTILPIAATSDNINQM